MICEFNSIDEIKKYINHLYENKKDILVSLVGKKKVNSKVSKITGVYNNFFSVESMVNDYNESFTICYRDIYIKNTIIEEIEV